MALLVYYLHIPHNFDLEQIYYVSLRNEAYIQRYPGYVKSLQHQVLSGGPTLQGFRLTQRVRLSTSSFLPPLF